MPKENKKIREEYGLSVPDNPHPIEPADNGFATLGAAMQGVISGLTSRLSLSTFPREVEYDQLPLEERTIVDSIMESLKPEIEEKAKELLYYETRDRIVKLGDLEKLRVIKKKKKVSLKRKKGCIYIQFGSGEPDDPIEEFLVAST